MAQAGCSIKEVNGDQFRGAQSMKNTRVQDAFLVSVAVMLFVGAAFVLSMTFGYNRVLEFSDAVLPFDERTTFHLATLLMFAASATLLVMREGQFRLMLTLWLGATFLLYHAGTRYSNGANLFVCLGNLDLPVTLSPAALSVLVFVGFSWMFLGSITFFVVRLLQLRKLKGKTGIIYKI